MKSNENPIVTHSGKHSLCKCDEAIKREKEIRKQITAEYSERISKAGFFRKIALIFKREVEISEKSKVSIPKDAV